MTSFIQNRNQALLKALTIACVFAAIGILTPAYAEKTGNGGGAWVCQNGDSIESIRWVQLVDLYEGRGEFGLDIRNIANRKYLEIVDHIMVNRVLPMSESMYRAINDELSHVKNNIVLIEAQLEIVEDSLFRIRPAETECRNGKLKYVQLANYTNYGKILIQKNLFKHAKLSEIDKAALFMHEAVYAYLRNEFRDTNSVRTRQIVGLLFSTLPQQTLKTEIAKVLDRSPNTIGMEFVRVKAERFLMGSPARSVELTEDYEIQTTEVTQKQWFEAMQTNPSQFKNRQNCPKSYQDSATGFFGCPDHPVENVSYVDVLEFISTINAKEKGSYIYRLPTEAEWEFAARAENRTAGNVRDDLASLTQDAWLSCNSQNQTHEVAQLKPNALGLYDMNGNVWEFVSNGIGPYAGALVSKPIEALVVVEVIRGGSFQPMVPNLSLAERTPNAVVQTEVCRSDSRSVVSPNRGASDLGLRLVRTKRGQ